MQQCKILFIDRDGTLIEEPLDRQVDTIEKLHFMPGVMASLLKLKQAGYSLVMVSNQDGLGTKRFSLDQFNLVQDLMLRIFQSQSIVFDDVRICPHFEKDNCFCRKPNIGLIQDFLVEQKINRAESYVIGDRETDMQLAKNMGILGFKIGSQGLETWQEISKNILEKDRVFTISRKTKETDIQLSINLDRDDLIDIKTDIAFLNHMLEQLAKHAGFGMKLLATGDIHIDDHHIVEDVAIVLGEAIRTALSDKLGIARYGFLLPMDESVAQVTLDLSGRSYFVFEGSFIREKVGDMATELIPHFFRSFAESLKATLHINVKGENTHHMAESVFKAMGRCLRQAVTKVSVSLPTTKGVL